MILPKNNIHKAPPMPKMIYPMTEPKRLMSKIGLLPNLTLKAPRPGAAAVPQTEQAHSVPHYWSFSSPFRFRARAARGFEVVSHLSRQPSPQSPSTHPGCTQTFRRSFILPRSADRSRRRYRAGACARARGCSRGDGWPVVAWGAWPWAGSGRHLFLSPSATSPCLSRNYGLGFARRMISVISAGAPRRMGGPQKPVPQLT